MGTETELEVDDGEVEMVDWGLVTVSLSGTFVEEPEDEDDDLAVPSSPTESFPRTPGSASLATSFPFARARPGVQLDDEAGQLADRFRSASLSCYRDLLDFQQCFGKSTDVRRSFPFSFPS
jgi:hypothetical protein